MFQTKSKKAVALMSVITSRDEEPSSTVMDQAVLVRAARRQGKSLMRSLALQIARVEGQRTLDECRVGEIMRIGAETVVPAAETMAKVTEQGHLMAERYPEIAPEIE